MRMELYGCLGNWPFDPTFKPTYDLFLIIGIFTPGERVLEGLKELRYYCTVCEMWETGH